MANESQHQLLWRLSDVAPNEPVANQRGIRYHAMPVDESPAPRDVMIALAQRYVDAINLHDVNGALALMDAQMIDRALPDEPSTTAGVGQSYGFLLRSFPDLSVDVTRIYVDGDMVVINGELRGTSQADFFGTPPTGKPFSTNMIEAFKVRGDRFVERYFWFDAMKIVRAITA